ncbi:MAG TPA: hypothetical protein VFY06_09960 [Verrucomicrobiae bacterium]|nr:hypothetical protein [Verrucomicrobiae bacterium]
MKSEPQWLSTNVAPDIIRDRPVKVKTKMAGETKGILKVKEKGDGLIAVSAQYDSSPFADMPKPSEFHLTQEQLDEYLGNAGSCVLNAPER